MKIFIALAVFVAATFAAPEELDSPTILRYESENLGLEGYHYDVETSDGIVKSEEGAIKPIGTESPIVVKGSYKYVDNDGTPFEVTYTADELGFHPSGAHLPK